MECDEKNGRDLYSQRLKRLAFFIQREENTPKPMMRRYALLVIHSTCGNSRVKVLGVILGQYLKEWYWESTRRVRVLFGKDVE